MPIESKTDWERVRQNIAEDAPIPYAFRVPRRIALMPTPPAGERWCTPALRRGRTVTLAAEAYRPAVASPQQEELARRASVQSPRPSPERLGQHMIEPEFVLFFPGSSPVVSCCSAIAFFLKAGGTVLFQEREHLLHSGPVFMIAGPFGAKASLAPSESTAEPTRRWMSAALRPSWARRSSSCSRSSRCLRASAIARGFAGA